MTYENFLALACPLALVLACGGGGDHKQSFQPHEPGTGGSAGSAGSGGSAGSAGTAGSAGQAGSAGATADAGSDSGETDAGNENDGAVVPDTLCPTTFTRDNEASLPLSGNGNERFGSITDDELTLAYTVPNGANGQVFVANRAQATDAFGKPEAVKGVFALDRASLAADGSFLLLVNADRMGFSLLQRSDAGKPFEPVSAWQYDDIVDNLADGEHLGDPVFALGGQVLLFSQYGAGRTHTVIFANRLSTGSAFVVGGELTNPELLAQGELRRRPTGVSSDYRTLFFYDEVSTTTKAGFFAGSFDFTSVSDLGDARHVQPSPDCARIYFDATGTSSDDLFIADAK